MASEDDSGNDFYSSASTLHNTAPDNRSSLTNTASNNDKGKRRNETTTASSDDHSTPKPPDNDKGSSRSSIMSIFNVQEKYYPATRTRQISNRYVKIIVTGVIILAVLGVGTGLFVRFGVNIKDESGSEQSAVQTRWKPWSSWDMCDVTCGVGVQKRFRECQEDTNVGDACVGESDESKKCFMESCIVYGNWIAWSDWSSCGVSCGDGLQTRSRICQKTSTTDLDCEGESSDQIDCNNGNCPEYSTWAPWSSWGFCAVSCGNGLQSRTRVCQKSFTELECVGLSFDQKDCNNGQCPVYGTWIAWSDWSSCGVSCGDGLQTRSRTCQKTSTTVLDCIGESSDEIACNNGNCPEYGTWALWGVWGTCTVSCGNGLQTRTRVCQKSATDLDCVGLFFDQQDCNNRQCPVYGNWMAWSDWSSCGVSCGDGLQTRSRTCQKTSTTDLDCLGEPFDQLACNKGDCPEYGTWAPWSGLGYCAVSCRNGLHTRTRVCQKSSNDLDCVGLSFAQQTCNNGWCQFYGNWRMWSDWSSCSVSCGDGLQTRSRICRKTSTSDLDCLGESSDEIACNNGNCPEYGTWVSWGVWGTCAVSCGNGLQTRTRVCQKSDTDLDCVGLSSDQQDCNNGQCPGYGNWMAWSDWSSCGVSCGDGLLTRSRTCQKTSTTDLDCLGEPFDQIDCNNGNCPEYGTWAPWSGWGSCAVSCGNGLQTRTRVCQKSSNDLDCVGLSFDQQICNNGQCQEYGIWAPWGVWGTCAVSCGNGLQTRTRVCQKSATDLDCVGLSSDQQDCNNGQCPVYGNWMAWSDWSSCSVSCGDGLKTRSRICQKTSTTDLDCVGESSDHIPCNNDICPEYGTWAPWSDWGSCAVSCGNGLQTRTRVCQKSSTDLDCVGFYFEQKDCNNGQCPVYGNWMAWRDWSSCGVSCGDGLQTRSRICQKTSPSDLDCLGESFDQIACNNGNCPEYGTWAPWGVWSSCPVSCGTGLQIRTRVCQKSSTDLYCVGFSFDQKDCNNGQCQVYGNWMTWSDWSPCGVSCGDGLQTRSRICQKTSTTDLDCVGESSDQSACNNGYCPVPEATWAAWGLWSTCDVTCGKGITVRNRECARRNTASGLCTGNSREVSVCNMQSCPVYGSWSRWTSWGACNTTCGGGVQTRTRICRKQSESDNSCVGVASMQQDCNKWDCPDCSKKCAVGVLNNACDTCVCDGTDITVRTLTMSNRPLIDVNAYAASAPTVLLATSDAGGFFKLTSLCVGAEIILTKEGFINSNVTLNSANVVTNLHKIEQPRMKTEPASKYRLAGGDAKFCCVATGSPAITYYEWFKDGVLLDKSLYPNKTEIELRNLSTEHSGQYRCRANSPVGAVFSKEATLSVRETPDDFCGNSVADKMITLPSDCVQLETQTTIFNVGTCLSKPCRNETSDLERLCSDTSFSCCRPSSYSMVNVKCTGYELSFPVVKSCTCSTCALPQLTISGVALGSVSNQPLNRGQVFLNGEFNQYTSSSGSFSISVLSSPDPQSVTLKFKDIFFNTLLDMVRVINIPGASTNNIYLSIKMIEKPVPVVFQSNVTNTLYGGTGNVTNSSSAVTKVVIPPNAFYYDNGTTYNGPVSIAFSYLLPTDLTESENIPGVFEFVNDDGETRQLETSGVFNIDLLDGDNNVLSVAEPMEVVLPDGASGLDPDTGESTLLWGLNENTGRWVLPDVQTKRRRKRTHVVQKKQSNYIIGEIKLNDYNWWNCDIFWYAPTCYFNPRIYDDSSLRGQIDQIALKLTYLFKRECSFCEQKYSARLKSHLYTGPSCQEVYCSDLPAYLELERIHSSGSVSLIAKQAERNSVYNVSDNGRTVSVIMSTNNTNFYETKQECEARMYDKGDLSFYIPQPKEDVYTFNMFQLEIPPNADLFDEFDCKSWCRRLGKTGVDSGRTKACALKVNVTSSSGKLSSLTVIVTSKMGDAKPSYKNDIIGIREGIPRSGYACVPYRCPTNIDGVTDQTKISVRVIGPTTCTIDIDAQSPALPVGIHETNTSVNFEVFDDELEVAGLYKVDHGLFRQKDDDCMLQNDHAKLECSRGSSSLATFRCG